MTGNTRWRACPGCGRQRLLDAGHPELMKLHKRWDPVLRLMVPCEGSGQPPAAGSREGAA